MVIYTGSCWLYTGVRGCAYNRLCLQTLASGRLAVSLSMITSYLYLCLYLLDRTPRDISVYVAIAISISVSIDPSTYKNNRRSGGVRTPRGISIYLAIALSLCRCRYLHLCIPIDLYLYPSMSTSLSLSLSLSIHLPVKIIHGAARRINRSLSISIYVYIPI